MKRLHPAAAFACFLSLIIFSMVFMNPVIVAANVLASGAYAVAVGGRKTFRFIFLAVLPIFLLISIVNPLVNVRGSRVLFYLFDRPFTLEALVYGMCSGGMLASVMLWFSAYNKVITDDKFMYLFSRLFSTVALLINITVGYIKSFTKKYRDIDDARTLSGEGGGRIRRAFSNLSVLLAMGLEGSVETADAMKSKGYGSARRTAYSRYRLSLRDAVVLVLTVAFVAAVVGFRIAGFYNFAFYPMLGRLNFSGAGAAAIAVYAGLLVLPFSLDISEALKWKIYESRI